MPSGGSAAEAFWSEGEAGAEHAEVIGLLSRRLNFRVKSVLALPLDRKAKYTAGLAAVSDGVAGRLLVTFHLTHQRADDEHVPRRARHRARQRPHRRRRRTGARRVKLPDGRRRRCASSTPLEDVDLYLHTLRLQDHATWSGAGRVP